MKVQTGIKAGQAQGLGDSVAEFTHWTGLDKLAELYSEKTGKDCGCEGRRQKLNQWVPYPGANA